MRQRVHATSEVHARTDAEAVAEGEEAVSEQRIRRDLAHHVDAHALGRAIAAVGGSSDGGFAVARAVAAAQAVRGHERQHAAQLFFRAHKGDHELDVGEAQHVARVLHRSALEAERVRELV